MDFQTRSEENGIRSFSSLASAMEAAEKDPTIWKISFMVGKENVRLVRNHSGWLYEPLFPVKQTSSFSSSQINFTFMD
jgi:hypothetical protein